MYDYTKLTLVELATKIGKARFFHLPKMLEEIFNKIASQSSKYKVFTAIIEQTGTNAPTFQILENTLGLTLETTYNSPGFYALVPNIELPLEKTTVDIGTPHPNSNTSTTKFQYTIIQTTNSLLQLNTFQAGTSSWTQTDNCIRSNKFEIRVYS